MKNYILLLTLMFMSIGLFSQQPCGNDSIAVIKEAIKLDPSTCYKVGTDIVSVEFAAIEGVTRFAVDQYKDVYQQVTEYYQQYKAGDKEIAASAKFMLPGTSDKFAVKIKGTPKEGFDYNKVHFVTMSGKEYEKTYIADSLRWEITVVSSDVNDGQELFAVYEETPGKYATIALINIYTYEPLERSVTLVPVNGQMNGLSKESVASGLNRIYDKIGVHWTVNELNAVFNYTPKNGSTFNVTGSGLFSTLTDDMKGINEAFKQSGEYQEDGLYLFILPFDASDKSEIAGTNGDMPLGSQFGYLFPGVKADDRTIAHEVGHGAFNLEHPFDRPLRNSFQKYALADNLMDYTDGTGFAKIQWDQTRAPGLVIGLFQTDKSGMAVNKDGFKIQETLRILRLIHASGTSYRFLEFPTNEVENIKIGSNIYSNVKIEFIQKTGQFTKEKNIIQYDNIKIITNNDNEASKLYDFILGKEHNIYGTYDGYVTLNGENITFDMITSQMENTMLSLLKSGKYNNLTYEEKIALLVPVIEWKLGYHYAASIFYYWFKGDKNNNTRIIKLSDENFKELFEKSKFFQEKLIDAEKDLRAENIYNVSSTNICLNNIKRAIIEGREIEINLPNDYEEPDRTTSDYISYFKSYAVSFTETAEILKNSIINDDFAYAIGSFTFNMSIVGQLKILGKGSRGYIEGEGIYYRIWDSFDFIGSQRLGDWNGDVFDASPAALYKFNFKTIRNSDFRSLYEKISGKKPNQDGSTSWDISIVTKYQKMNTNVVGIDYAIDLFDNIKSSIDK